MIGQRAARAMNGGVKLPPSVPSRGAKAAPWRPRLASLRQRAAAFVQRPESLSGRDGRADLVVVVRSFGLRGFLHFDQVGRMKRAAVDTHRALAEERIVARELLHPGDHLGTVVPF